MAIKEVYAIRLNRKDESLRHYLEQFDVKRQSTELKKLLHLGVSTVQAQCNEGDMHYPRLFTPQHKIPEESRFIGVPLGFSFSLKR